MSFVRTSPCFVHEPPVAVSKVDRLRLEETINGLAITRHMGAVVELLPDGQASAIIHKLKRFHLGGAETDVVNGAVLLGLLDCVNVAGAMMRAPGHQCATVELSVKFVRQVKVAPITTIGTCIRNTGRLLFTQGEVRDTDGNICCVATGIVSLLASRKLGGNFDQLYELV